jgi:hypothetical protein
MTPGQLGIIAAVHRVANDPDAPPLEAEDTAAGSVGDLLMFAAMTRL